MSPLNQTVADASQGQTGRVDGSLPGILVKLLLGVCGGEAGPQARLPPRPPREKVLLLLRERNDLPADFLAPSHHPLDHVQISLVHFFVLAVRGATQQCFGARLYLRHVIGFQHVLNFDIVCHRGLM